MMLQPDYCLFNEFKKTHFLCLFYILALPPNIIPAIISRFWLNFLKIFLAYLTGRPQKFFKKFTSKSENSTTKAYSEAVP